MSRIAKKPEERRIEILETAQRLFFEVGYEKTSVERIINELNLAKGTFYYYFKSKADLLVAIADLHADSHYEKWQQIIDRQDLNAVEKLNAVFDFSLNFKLGNKELIIAYLKAMMDEQNIILHYKMAEKRNQVASELLGQVVEQGIREGLFDTPYPRESIIMIFKLADFMTGELVPLLLKMFEDANYLPLVEEKYDAITFAMERILGADKGTISIYDHDTLKKFVNSE